MKRRIAIWSAAAIAVGGGGNASSAHDHEGAPASGAEMHKAAPVSSTELYREMRIQGGQHARGYRHQILVGDFSCDGVEDRIAGWVDLDSPEGPRFAMLFVTNHVGAKHSEMRFLPFEQSEQFALCVHDETAPPAMSWQVNSIDYMREILGDADMCNIAIRVEDFMCDAPQFFFSEKGGENDDHWMFFRN